MIAAARDGMAHVAKFLVEAMMPDPDARTPARDVRAAYMRWCRERRQDALPAPEMADHLTTLCNKAGLRIDTVDGKPLIVGLKLLN
jgi:hypothetical protein